MPPADLSLDFVCPICGAEPQEKCEMNSGTPRFSSHVERWDIANDYLRRTGIRKKTPLAIWAETTPKA